MKPAAVVTFAGTEQTCLVERGVLRHGRDDPSSAPVADSATLDVFGAIPAGVDIGSAIAVDAIVAGVTYPRFAGLVTDLAIGWRSVDQPAAQLVAVGELASLGRRIVGDAPYPAELDGARANRAIAAAGVPTDALRTDPGTVQVLARDVDAQPALVVAQDAASDGAGIVWQAKDGAVLYADALHRKASWGAAIELDACTLPLTVEWAKGLEGLCNDVRIRYGPEPPAELHATAPASIAELGTFGASLSTRLATASDASARAQFMLNRQARPAWVLSGIGIWLELVGRLEGLSEAADEAATAALLELEVHDLVSVTGLPAGSPHTSATLWVEGWSETIAADSWHLELAVSDYCRSSVAPRWDDLPDTLTWDTLGSRTWDEVHCLEPAPPAGRWNDVPSSLRWDEAGATAWDSWS